MAEDGDAAVGAGGGGDETVLVGTEGDAVDGGVVQVARCVDECPFAGTGFAVDEDGAVEGAGGEDYAEFGV